MATTEAATTHDQNKSPMATPQTPQGLLEGQRQPEQSCESSPPLHRYLGNSYLQAMTTTPQRLGLQAKLRVNESGDIYEQEADRVADQVMAAPTHANVRSAPLQIQRFSNSWHGQTDAAPASVGQTLASPGRPLEPLLRQDMEQRFGHDFSAVRVHTDAAAEQSARDVNAHAYTLGHSIVFGAGQFAPGTAEGRRLIAHELTHVVQQSGAKGGLVGQAVASPVLQRKPDGKSPSEAADPIEEENFPEYAWHRVGTTPSHGRPGAPVIREIVAENTNIGRALLAQTTSKFTYRKRTIGPSYHSFKHPKGGIVVRACAILQGFHPEREPDPKVLAKESHSYGIYVFSPHSDKDPEHYNLPMPLSSAPPLDTRSAEREKRAKTEQSLHKLEGALGKLKEDREQEARDKINALPPHIRDFLTSDKKNLSGEDLLKAASAGTILQQYGVTPKELLLRYQLEEDWREIGFKGEDRVTWSLSYGKSRAAQQVNATTLLQAAQHLSLASLNLYKQDPLLEIIAGKSRISALATHTAIQSGETRPMDGPREEVESPFSGLGELRTTLRTFENALVADLRALATSFLDDTEVRLVQVQDRFVGNEGKGWGPGYLQAEIEKVNNDPDVIKVQKEHKEFTQAIDQEQQEDDQKWRTALLARQYTHIYYQRKKERQDKRDKEQQQYTEALRQAVARKSILKLPPGTDVNTILSANSGHRAQVILRDAIFSGRKKVREAREKLSDLKFLYAADIVINKEKEFLSQALAAGSDSNRYQEGTLEHAFAKGFAAKQWNTVNFIIDKLAEERKAQTTIWQDIVKVFNYVSMFIPGPIGWAARFAGAAANFDQSISAASTQDAAYRGGLRSDAADPNAGLKALGEAAVQIVPDVPGAAKGATRLTLGLRETSEREVAELAGQGVATAGRRELTQGGDEAARLGEQGAATVPGKQVTKPPAPEVKYDDLPKSPPANNTDIDRALSAKPQPPTPPRQPAAAPAASRPVAANENVAEEVAEQELAAAANYGPVGPRVVKGNDTRQSSARVSMVGTGGRPPSGGRPTPGSVQPATPARRRARPPQNQPQVRGDHPRAIRRDQPRREFEDEGPTQVDLEPAGAGSRGSATPSGGGPSQVPDTVQGEISKTEFTGPPARTPQGQTPRAPSPAPPKAELPATSAPPRRAAEKPEGAASAERKPQEPTIGAGPERRGPGGGAGRLYQDERFQEAQKELQSLVDQINPLQGTQNCVPAALAMDGALATGKASVAPVTLERTGVEEVATRWGKLEVKQIQEVGTRRSELEAQLGGKLNPTGAIGLQHELLRAGHGARAIAVDRSDTIGHAYNVVNRRGMLIAVDAQSRTIRPFDELFAELKKANDDWTMMWYRTDNLKRSGTKR